MSFSVTDTSGFSFSSPNPVTSPATWMLSAVTSTPLIFTCPVMYDGAPRMPMSSISVLISSLTGFPVHDRLDVGPVETVVPARRLDGPDESSFSPARDRLGVNAQRLPDLTRCHEFPGLAHVVSSCVFDMHGMHRSALLIGVMRSLSARAVSPECSIMRPSDALSVSPMRVACHQLGRCVVSSMCPQPSQWIRVDTTASRSTDRIRPESRTLPQRTRGALRTRSCLRR